jgi:hypothetical protein
MLVMPGDFEHSLTRNVSTAEDIFEKRDDVFAFFRSAETDDENGVIGRVRSRQIRSSS